MSTHRSRTADPLPDVPSGSTMGMWGMWLTVGVLLAGLAGLGAAALYLHSGQPAWPPDGVPAPASARAVAGVLLAAVALTVLTVARRWLISGPRTAVAPLLLVAMGASIASVWSLVTDLLDAPFRWDEHAYTSVYWVLTGSAAMFVGVATLMLGAVLVQRLTGVLDARRMLELEVTLTYLRFAVLATVVLIGLVHLLPDPGGGL